MVFVRALDVDLIEASGKGAKPHVQDKEYLVRCSLRALAPQLDPRRFLRVHESTILNLDRVKEVQRGSAVITWRCCTTAEPCA